MELHLNTDSEIVVNNVISPMYKIMVNGVELHLQTDLELWLIIRQSYVQDNSDWCGAPPTK